ncbi:BTAD domain-containing putative transcriptional regulator [Nocardiopsis sediminis]|uniref:BTAD domain-containing putative transcriptional regulator n=1 Tax=Nocardiopsis sediminis TaxID=1778267 RepID=A0ABV8FKF3_9ACTN
MSHPELRFGVLGPLRVHAGERAVELNAVKPRMLLATLLLDADRVVPLDTIVEALWPQRPPRSAVANVRTYASALRSALGGDRLRSEVGGYAIRVEPGELDLHTFDDLVRRAAAARGAGRHEEALGLLDDALGYWRGRPLEDLPAGAAWEDAIGRISEGRVAAAEEHAALHLALGRHTAAIAPLRALLADHPFRERLWLHLMLAHYGSGQRAEALGAYAEVRRLLVAELGVEPCAELRQVHDSVLRGDPVARTVAAALASVLPHVVPAVCQLPRDLPDFHGRDTALRDLRHLAGDGRGTPAVVVAGPPGVGKSALATRAGHTLRDRFPDGQLHLDLGGTGPEPASAHDLLGDLLRWLGVVGRALPSGVAARAALYRSRMAGRRMLLILDAAACADQVRPLLPGAEGCAVIVTSRRRLSDLAGARLLELGMLDAAASRALLESSGAPGAAAADPAAAEAIMRSCGGLPLAIRQAGGRLAGRRAWPPRVLAERLADEPRRLTALGVRPGFAAAFGDLPGPAAAAFTSLGALGAASSLPTWAIGALVDRDDAEAEDVVDALVEAHAIEPAGVDAIDQPRFTMHELVRLYARELADAPGDRAERRACLERVAGGWLALVESANAGMPVSPFVARLGGARRRPPGGAAARRAAERPRAWFDAERPALVEAVARAAEAGLADHAWELAAALVPYFDMHGHYGDWYRTHRSALAAVQAAGHRRGQAALLRGLGQLRAYQGDHERATDLFDRSRRMFAACGDGHGESIALSGLATVARMRGRYPEAMEHCHRALEGALAAGDRHGEALIRASIGRLWRARGDTDTALDWLSAALDLSRDTGDRHREAHVLHEIGLLRAAEGAHPAALARFRAALAIFHQIGDREGITGSLAVIDRTTRATHTARGPHTGHLRTARTPQPTRTG